jgi:hypothetical protein
MARPEKQIPKTLEEAVAELKRDPSHPLRLAVNDVEVEIRLVAPTQQQTTDDLLNGATWYGESAEELVKLIRQGRELDEPPEPRPL